MVFIGCWGGGGFVGSDWNVYSAKLTNRMNSIEDTFTNWTFWNGGAGGGVLRMSDTWRTRGIISGFDLILNHDTELEAGGTCDAACCLGSLIHCFLSLQTFLTHFIHIQASARSLQTWKHLSGYCTIHEFGSTSHPELSHNTKGKGNSCFLAKAQSFSLEIK